MSNQTKLIAAVVAFFALGGGALYLILDRQSEEQTQDADQNLPTLPEVDREAITALVITRPAQEEGGSPETVRLEKRDGTWFVTEPVEAEADQSAVDTALSRLDELELTGIAATNPDNHERLEVTDAKAIRVEAHAGDTSVITLLVGAYRGRSTMARLPDDDRVLSLAGSIKFAFNKALKDWRNKRVVEEGAENVAEIRFESANGTFSFLRGAEGAWTQSTGETVIERFGSTKVQSLVSSLANLRAVDFAAADVTPSAAGFDEPTATVTMQIREPAEEGAEPPAPRTIRLQVGGAREGGSEHYVRREGDETIYVISQYLADRVRPAADAFQDAEPGAEGASEMAPEMPPGLGLGGPGGPGGLGGPGGGQIPPELMEQIQRQLQQAASMM